MWKDSYCCHSNACLYIAKWINATEQSFSWEWWRQFLWTQLLLYKQYFVLGRPGQGASQVKKSPHLNWATKFLTAYNGACSPNVSVRMAWISLEALPCRGGKPWWQLMSLCCWNRARCLTCFLSASVTRKTCNSTHEQTPLSNDTINSVLQHREVGWAKDLSDITFPDKADRVSGTKTFVCVARLSQACWNELYQKLWLWVS